MRTLWLIIGLMFLALGLAGTVLPVLPTTPFLLVATAAFAKSSPRLHAWLINHPLFGPPIQNWEVHGAISVGAKRLSIGTMVAVFAISVWAALSWKILLAQAVLMVVGAGFILTRPSGPSGK